MQAHKKKAREEKATDEIDEIFAKPKKIAPSAASSKEHIKKDAQRSTTTNKSSAGSASKKTNSPKSPKQPSKGAESDKPKKKVQASALDELLNPALKKKQRRVEDGVKVYTEDELGLNKDGGGTADCPFDCKCCY